MNDMGPRRMDGFGPAGRPAGVPQPRPQQPAPRVGPAPRPMAPQQPQPRPVGRRPVAPAQRQPMARPVAAPAGASWQPVEPQAQASPKRGGRWRVVVQFVIGLLVIIGVAAAIVALYVRYYQ